MRLAAAESSVRLTENSFQLHGERTLSLSATSSRRDRRENYRAQGTGQRGRDSRAGSGGESAWEYMGAGSGHAHPAAPAAPAAAEREGNDGAEMVVSAARAPAAADEDGRKKDGVPFSAGGSASHSAIETTGGPGGGEKRGRSKPEPQHSAGHTTGGGGGGDSFLCDEQKGEREREQQQPPEKTIAVPHLTMPDEDGCTALFQDIDVPAPTNNTHISAIWSFDLPLSIGWIYLCITEIAFVLDCAGESR